MANLLQSGVTWLAGVQKDGASVEVTLRSGVHTTTGIAAVKTKSEALEEADEGKFLDIESTDFLILAADFLVNGAAVKPDDGMTIEWNGSTFELRPFANEPCWRWSDEYETRYRIHTKLKSRS